MSFSKRTNKKYYRRNKSNILLLLFLIVLAYFSFHFDVYQTIIVNTDFHVKILTINSIFAGFLFTSLGIMISILDQKRITRLDKAGYMDNYFNGIYIGLFFHVLSIIISLMLIIIPGIDISYYLVKTEQASLFIGVSFFVKSVINILKIIAMVRQG